MLGGVPIPNLTGGAAGGGTASNAGKFGPVIQSKGIGFFGTIAIVLAILVWAKKSK